MQFKCLLLFYPPQFHMRKDNVKTGRRLCKYMTFHVQKPLISLLAFNISLFLKSVPILPMEILNYLQSSWEMQGWTWEGAKTDLCKGILWLLEDSSVSLLAGVVWNKLLQTNWCEAAHSADDQCKKLALRRWYPLKSNDINVDS